MCINYRRKEQVERTARKPRATEADLFDLAVRTRGLGAHRIESYSPNAVTSRFRWYVFSFLLCCVRIVGKLSRCTAAYKKTYESPFFLSSPPSRLACAKCSEASDGAPSRFILTVLAMVLTLNATTSASALAASYATAPMIAPDFHAFVATLFSFSALQDWLKLFVVGGLLETLRRYLSSLRRAIKRTFWITANFESRSEIYRKHHHRLGSVAAMLTYC